MTCCDFINVTTMLQSYSFCPEQDVEALHELIVECWQAYGPVVTFHVGDLHWRLRPQPERLPEQDIRLWYNEADKLRALAWFDPPNSGDILCHPTVDRTVVEPALLEWLENKARSQNVADFTVVAFESDSLREELLTARGYQKQSDFLHHMQRQLDHPIVTADIKEGYFVSTTAAADLLSLSNAIASVFGSDPKPVSAYEALRSSPFYRNDLDIVIKSERGEVVAFCLAWLDEKNKVGLLEPVGCHPEHRRLGLASAAVRTALKALKSADAQTSVLHHAGDSHSAFKLYKKCGFTPLANDYDWTIVL